MSAYSDQEEIEKLKEWWKNYGRALLVGVVLGLALLFGHKYWTQYNEAQRAAASDLYAQMLQQVQGTETDGARASGVKLMEEYRRTPYAGMAALMLARLDFEANDAAAARRQLEWAVANATDPAVAHAARLRLGRLHLAEREYDAALVLVQRDVSGFEADYLELQGDAYAGLGKPEEARAAYREALQHLGAETPARALVKMKLDDLGETPRG